MVGLEITIRSKKPRDNQRSRENNRSNDNRRGRNDWRSNDRGRRDDRNRGRSRDDRGGGRSRITETATVETEVITVAKMRTTPEMTGIVENVATLTSHSEQNAIVVGHQRDAAAEAHPNSGLATIEELVIETNHHNLALEIGNVESARK